MAAQPLVRDVLLRDGSTLRLRAPGPEDLDDLKAFYGRLSPESRYLRFHGHGRVDVAAADYANADGDDRVALIGRQGDRVVAAAGYDVLREPGAAEVAFAVADDFQGRGAATRLLEQLAAIAAERGIHRFDAEVMQGNRGMLSVFERAGFGVRRKSAYGELTVSLDISPDEAVLERIDARDHRGVVASLRPILAPASLAVVGASSAPGKPGRRGPGRTSSTAGSKGWRRPSTGPAASSARSAWRAVWPSSTSHRSSWSSRSLRTTCPMSPPKRRNAARRRC